MKVARRGVLAFGAMAIVVFGLAAAPFTQAGALASPNPSPVTAATGGAGHIEQAQEQIAGQYIVTLRPASDATTYSRALNAFTGVPILQTYTHALDGFTARMSEGQALALTKDPAVASVAEDGIVHVATTQNNPPSWGLDRIDQHNLPLNGSYTYTSDGFGVTAYVIDTGVRTTHTDFGGRASIGVDEIGGDTTCAGSSIAGHATHVAGTIGGTTYGVAKLVSIVSVRVLDCSGSGSFTQVIAGIDWATADHIARGTPAVANMSLGGSSYQPVDDAVESSVQAGITYAIAAGNSNVDACSTSPARAPDALTVGASDITDNRASFSNYGTCLDLFAPGVNITSDWNGSNSDTNTISGTSMATPHVAGTAALYLSQHPNATPAQVASALLNNTTNGTIGSPGTGSPNKLDFAGSFGPTAPSAPVVTATPGSTNVGLSWSAPADGGSPITGYKVYRGTTPGGEDMVTPIATPAGTSFNDTGLTTGTTYYYKVSAHNSVGDSVPSVEVSATPATAPGTPALNAATAGNASVSLSWAAPSSNGGSAITGYKVYRSITLGGEGSIPIATLGVTLSYNDTGLTNGQQYFYTVAAVNAAGTSTQSNEKSATPVATVPAAPTVSATATSGQVALSWSTPANGGSAITNYNVYRGTTPGGEGGTAIATPAGTSFNDTGVTNGTTYYYKVSAHNTIGDGAQSNEVSAAPTAVPPGPLPGATVLTATPHNASVTLTWPAAAPGTAPTIYYTVSRGTTPNGETAFSYINGTTFTDPIANNGTTYYYRVAAHNANGDAPPSNEANATPTPAPPAPTAPSAPVVTATPGSTNVGLSWSAPADGGSPITGYKVYRGTTPGGEDMVTPIATPAGTSFNDTGLTTGTTYYYKVSAHNSVGDSVPSVEVSATPATAPGTPALNAATAGNASVSLSWAAPSSNGGSAITGYKVYRSITLGGEGSIPIATLGVTLSYNDTGLTNGQQYFYTVAAVNAAGTSTQSNEKSATPVALPSAPVVTATPGSTNVGLSWSAPADGGSPITGYKVYRGTTPGGEDMVTPIATPAGTSFNDTGLTTGTTYYYKVSAHNSVGDSVPSVEVSATPATAPGTPTLNAATAGNASVSLSWAAPSSNGGSAITGYKVYRSITLGGEGSIPIATLGVTLSYNDTGLTNGQQYFYTVAAVNAAGTSTQSNEKSATPVATVPAAPTVSATATSGQVALSWSTPANGGSAITNYNVYRGTTPGGEGGTAIATPAGTSFNDTGVTNGTTYYYKVSAHNTIGDGAQSNEVSAAPTAVPPGPLPGATVLTATPHNASVTLTWPAAAPGTAPTIYYTVSRGTTPNGETAFSYINGTTFTDPIANNGTTYYYRVAAHNANGDAPPSNEANATPTPAPPAPTAPSAPVVTATPGSTNVGLSWSAPADGGSPITGYKVYRGTTPGGEDMVTPIATPAGTSFNDTGLTTGTTYYYKVSAHNSVGDSVPSVEVSATPATAPGTPALNAATAGNASVSLSWAAPSSNGGSAITGYKVYRSITLGGEGSIPIATLGVTLSYNDTGLTNGQQYFYTVAAVNAAGTSTQSNEKSATPVATVPAAPTVSATATSGQVALSWSTPANGGSAITNYNVYRGTTPGGEGGTAIATPAGTSFNDTGVTNGTTYYYKVSAHNTIGDGAQSNEVSAAPTAVPPGPLPGATVLTATPHNASVTLTWPAAAPGTAPTIYYTVSRGTTPNGETAFAYINGTTFTDPIANNGTTYYYRVAAHNANGDAPPSNEANATPLSSLSTAHASGTRPSASYIGFDWFGRLVPPNFVTIGGVKKHHK